MFGLGVTFWVRGKALGQGQNFGFGTNFWVWVEILGQVKMLIRSRAKCYVRGKISVGCNILCWGG